MQIFDISPKVTPILGVFPGDQPFQVRRVMDFKSGDHLVLSSILTTVHLGAHADSPLHYAPAGSDISECDLTPYLGDAQVLEVVISKNERIQVAHLESKKILAKRVLFKTGTFPDPNNWNHDFAGLSGDLIDFLAAKNVLLVGIDTPSVDLENDKLLESHHALARNDMRVLEGIDLSSIPEGIYKLVALPLKLSGVEASPVRAVLIKGSI